MLKKLKDNPVVDLNGFATNLCHAIFVAFFIAYLLNIITSISKANTIIVSTTNANKSMYIISNKTASIIAFPLSYNKSCIKGQTTSAYSLNSYV